jgi:hypothetical protein
MQQEEVEGKKLYRNIVLNGVGAQEGTRSANLSARDFMDDNTNGVAITENTVANNGG